MTFTCRNLTVSAERALRVDFRAAFHRWRRLPEARRLDVIQRIRDEASLDETEAGADLEIAANMLEALSKACERRRA